MKTYFGLYNHKGYAIFDGKGNQVYSDGNSYYDSQAYVPAWEGADIGLIKEWCKGTGEEIAEENGGKFCGIEYDKNVN